MNDPGGLWSRGSTGNRPRTNLFHTGCEVGVQLKQVVGLANQAIYPRLLELEVVKEHAALLVGFEFGDVGLGRRSQVKHASTFFDSHCAHLFNPGVSCFGGRLFDVADVHHGLVRKQLVVGDPGIFFFGTVKATNRLALLDVLLESFAHLYLSPTLSGSALGGLASTIYALFKGFKVLELQLKIYGFFVAKRIHAAVYVHDVVVLKAAQHVQKSIALPDVAQKLVAQAFSLAGSLDQACYVNNLHRGGNHALGIHDLGKGSRARVGHVHRAYVGLNGAKGKVCSVGLGVAQAVE